MQLFAAPNSQEKLLGFWCFAAQKAAAKEEAQNT